LSLIPQTLMIFLLSYKTLREVGISFLVLSLIVENTVSMATFHLASSPIQELAEMIFPHF